MTKKNSKQQPTESEQTKPPHPAWDLAKETIKGLLRLADRDKIWGLVVLCFTIMIGLWGGLFIYCCPPDQLILLFESGVNTLERLLTNWSTLGWCLCVISWLGFAILYKTCRRRMDEIAEQKRALETKLMGGDRPSSSGRSQQ